jgi:hypothetical protein
LILEFGRWFICVPIAADVVAKNQGRAVVIAPVTERLHVETVCIYCDENIIIDWGDNGA